MNSASDEINPNGKLLGWLLGEARFLTGEGEFEKALVERIIAAGVPLSRFTTGVPSLHPEVNSFSTLWERGAGLSYREFRIPAGDTNLQDSPIFAAYRTGKHGRYRLNEGALENEYPLLAEFRAAGMTDYLVLALPFSDGSFKAMSFSTDLPDGFSKSHVGWLESLALALAGVLEIHHLRRMARILVSTYVGPFAGQRVLNGEIKRGSGESVEAVIWFCDLRGFTALSDRLPADQLIDMLNRYFEIMTGAIGEHQGEVLKFIGDAVLAIFRSEPASHGANAALEAAKQAIVEIATYNQSADDPDLPELACGIALHAGTVIYGNVGGTDRLDFTVIGPAVNLASRIESLTRELDQDILVSADFAKLCEGAFVSCGRHRLKGIRAEQEIFAPR